MRTYVKYAVRPGSATKAKKFNLKFDPEKNMWYTNDIEEFRELKRLNNLKIMKRNKKSLTFREYKLYLQL